MLELSEIGHHPVLEEIVNLLCIQTQQEDKGFFRAEVAYFLGKMAASMRATIVTKDRGEIPVNIYALALATSGFGKGHSIGIMENELMAGFRRRFRDDTYLLLSEQRHWVLANQRAVRNSSDVQEEFEKVQKDWRSKGPFVFDFDSGSTPAVKQFREKLLLSDGGAINLQIDEIGSNLTGSTEVLTSFLELYDQGLIKTKLTKNTADNSRTEELDGKTPANLLMFGTPAKLFDGSQTEEQFYSFLETGYARRCIFGYGHDSRGKSGLTAEQIYAKLTDRTVSETITKISYLFHELADPARFNWKMVVEDDVGIELLAYRLDCEQRAKKLAEHEEIKKAEISHRYFKALKLAGAFAFIDQSTEVEKGHLHSAIKLVEESGEAFFKILSRDKAYVRLAKYIAAVGEEVTHADLNHALPFYGSSNQKRNELMGLATSWGYKHHIIIKKSFIDGIELFKGETLKETNTEECLVSYSNHWAYNYVTEKVPFESLHMLTQAEDFHWINHEVRNGHRAEESIVPGFNLIVIDVDQGTPLALAHELLKDYKFLTYTTKRHRLEGNGDRFRIVLPTNYVLELDGDEYKEMMNAIYAWLPFPEKTDEGTNQRSKKWQSHPSPNFKYNEGALFDVLPFIPKTRRNEEHRAQLKELGSLDNLERWFAQRMVNGSRNNQMIKFALALVDSGMSFAEVHDQVKAFNAKLNHPLMEQELDMTVLVTVAKKYQS